jgi:dienelactone hydrolase
MHGEGPYAADGFFFTPADPNLPGSLLLIPGKAGVSPAIQLAAQKLAEAGYRVVLLDPNRGGSPELTPPEEQTWADIGAALKFLDAQSVTHPVKLGVLGVGEGARMALRLARERLVNAVAIESHDSPRPNDLPTGTPLLASLAGPAKPHRSAPHSSLARIEFYGARDGAASDQNALFDSADLVKIRQNELEFFAQHLGPR